MNEVKWNNHFNIGVEVIDQAHQKLFSIIGKMFTLGGDEKKQQHACREAIKFFKSYALQHFAEEEAYMLSINYEGYAIHKSRHDDMRDKTLPALELELEEQNYSAKSVRHFIGICIGWLNEHIMIEDHAITGHTIDKWVPHPPENELVALERAIVQVMQVLFRVDARLVSKHYSGEDFSAGDKLCYHLTYVSREGKPCHVLLAIEESLALHTLSEMLGKEIKKADKTVVYAGKILTQQFVERIAFHFDSEAGYKLARNEALTFDQFLHTFDDKYPPYSLLFDTGGKGYFAVCIQ